METKDNKYLKGYWFIIERAKLRTKPEGYTEKHHIYPKSIYGQNKDLIHLTAKEHFLVHYMLWKGLRAKYGTKDINTRKMANGFNKMRNISSGQKRYISAIKYEELKISASEAKKGIKFSKEHKEKIKISRKLYFDNLSAEEKLKLKSPKTDIHKINISISNKAFYKNNPNIHSGINNPNYNKGYYKSWIEKYGKEEADKMNYELGKSRSIMNSGRKYPGKSKGESNPMYGTHGFYEKWVEKYGKEEADRRQEETIKKRNATKLNNKLKEVVI